MACAGALRVSSPQFLTDNLTNWFIGVGRSQGRINSKVNERRRTVSDKHTYCLLAGTIEANTSRPVLLIGNTAGQ